MNKKTEYKCPACTKECLDFDISTNMYSCPGCKTIFHREEFHRFLTFREMGEEKKASEILDKAIKNLPRKQEEEKLKEGEKDMSSKRGKCNGCGKERALVSGGKCWKCYRDTRKGKKKTKVCHEPAPAAEKARVETTVVLRGGQEEYKIPLSITCDLVVCIRNVQAKQ